jgi:DNA-binding response OmpR family regulator
MNVELGCILLVDRSRGSLLFHETILRRRNTVVITALGGSDGLQRAREEHPHLIVFGYDLFDMAGPEFCREIRGDEGTQRTSLLLVADRANPEQAELCLSAGCNDVIYRPILRRELDRKVQKLTTIPVRRQLRTITKIDVSLEKNGRFVLGRSLNISANGMLLEIDRMLPGDTAVRLHFYLPSDARPLELQAHVLRAEFTGTMAKYGLQFLDLTEDERQRIERYVERLRSRELL